MTAKAIEASSAMLVTSIAVAIISTTTPDHAGVRAPAGTVPSFVLGRTSRDRRSSATSRRPTGSTASASTGGVTKAGATGVKPAIVTPSRSGDSRGRIGHTALDPIEALAPGLRASRPREKLLRRRRSKDSRRSARPESATDGAGMERRPSVRSQSQGSPGAHRVVLERDARDHARRRDRHRGTSRASWGSRMRAAVSRIKQLRATASSTDRCFPSSYASSNASLSSCARMSAKSRRSSV